MLKRTIATVFVTALLCLVALPVTALATAPNGQVIYVGNENVTSGGYWTTDSAGNVTQYNEEGKPSNNYIHYNTATNTLTLHNATIKEEVPLNTSTYVAGAAIGVHNQNGDAELTITLEGTNTIAEVGTGIYVLASSTGGATLTITGDGSLDASASQTGIWVQSNSGNGTLAITGAKVTASSSSGGNGVQIRVGDGSNASLTVDGGNLTATGSGVRGGIEFQFGSGGSGSGTPSLNVSNSAIVKASGDTGGITSNSSPVTPSGTGIVFNNGTGTVYGNVTLQEGLEIGEGESLKLADNNASLNAGNHNVIVDGGTLDESLKASLGDSVTYVVRGVSLDRSALTLTEGGTAQLIARVEPIDATNKKVTWSSSAPVVATVDASGNVTAVAEGTATITATTEDGAKTATCTVTVEHDPAGAWSSDASGHWHACAGCGEKLNLDAHSGKVVGKRDATCTEAGYTGDTVCSICGYVVAKGVATPATGHSYQDGACTVCGAQEPAKDGDAIPATGDFAPMACALLGIFGIALVAAGLRKRTPW